MRGRLSPSRPGRTRFSNRYRGISRELIVFKGKPGRA
jgi:hypothetical protein